MPRKLPYLIFYVGDWVKDTRILPLGIRAIWMDMLCLMHDGDRRGYLSRNGSPLTPEQIAAFCGCSAAEVTHATRVLIDSGVGSCTEHGVLYSRRMVKDERKRSLCSEAGKRGGGNPTFKGPSKGHPKVKPKVPMDSGNSNGLDLHSKGKKGKGGAGEGEEGFAEFWAAYPRRQKRLKALEAWRRIAPDAAVRASILAALERDKRSDQWRRGIIPHPTTWQQDRRWEDEDFDPPLNGGQSLFSGIEDFVKGGPFREP